MADPAHPLSLSAGCVLDLAPAETVACAAEAGFTMVGVRLADPRADAPGVAAQLAATGLELLDVEVVRVGPGPLTDAHRALADAAAELGARFLLTVADDPGGHDPGLVATSTRIAELADRLHGAGTRVALEPMRFTAVRTRAAAEQIARGVGDVVVLPDPLHLHRAGEDLAAPADPALTGYAQLSDVAEPASAPVDLSREARHHRVPPGQGGLDLTGFVDALPDGVPLAVEVQSDELRRSTPPVARALLLRRAAQDVLAARRARSS